MKCSCKLPMRHREAFTIWMAIKHSSSDTSSLHKFQTIYVSIPIETTCYCSQRCQRNHDREKRRHTWKSGLWDRSNRKICKPLHRMMQRDLSCARTKDCDTEIPWLEVLYRICWGALRDEIRLTRGIILLYWLWRPNQTEISSKHHLVTERITDGESLNLLKFSTFFSI